MKKKAIVGIKPIKTEHNEIFFRGARISYTVSDYRLASSAFAYVMFFTADSAFFVRTFFLKEPLPDMKKAKNAIIRLSKNWIRNNLKTIKKL